MIRERAAGPVEDVELRGLEAARPTPEVLDAIAHAEAIVIGPSNPVISIGPILAVVREAIDEAPAPVVAVSPLVRGAVLKGPTAEFLAWAGHPLSSEGIAAHYAGLLDGLVADERAESVPTLVTDVEMGDQEARRRVARDVLAFSRGARRLGFARAHRRGPAGQVVLARQAAARRRGRRQRARGAGRRHGGRRAARARRACRRSTRSSW